MWQASDAGLSDFCEVYYSCALALDELSDSGCLIVLQLKEMVERVPERHNDDSSTELCAEYTQNIIDHSLDVSHIRNTAILKNEGSSNVANLILPNGAKTQSGKAEWVVQDETGVFVSLSPQPGGGNELMRVRFRYVML